MKLFVINIVASSFRGFSSRLMISASSFLSDESVSKSVCESEKKATSVPEMSAEQSNKIKSATPFKRVATSKLAKNNMSKGSGSGSKC